MGGISKLSGNRRKPYCARVTDKWIYDEEKQKKKQIQKVIGYYRTKSEALQALVDYNRDPYNLDATQVTFDELYKMVEFTEATKRNYEAAYKYLAPVADKPIRSLKANQMQKCIDACTTTQQQEIKTVCHKVFAYALQNEVVDRDPSRYLHSNSVTKRREREVLTNEQAAGLENIGEWWSKITLMLLYSGMRTKELKQLDPEWIDTENGVIDIQLAKNKSSLRKIPIHSHVLPLFCDYKDFGGNLYGYTHDGLNKALKTFCGHTAHDCRHTFATRMREYGCDPLVLQLLLGHTPTTITERVYTHLTIAELSEYLERLNYDT